MTNQRPSQRLQELLEALANDALAREQHLELQSLLRDDPAAQKRYFAYLDLHLGLRQLLSKPEQEAMPVVAPVRQKSVPRSWLILISLAAMLLVIVGGTIYVQKSGRTTSTAVASVLLKQSAGARLFGESLPRIGGALQYDHEYALTNGMMELLFPSGAEVILEAPSVVVISSKDRLIVKVGACSVHAPPGAEGFRVETPHAEVIDLGTRFSVNVNEVGETDVQVIEGAADVHPRSAPTTEKPTRLTGGNSQRFSDSDERVSQPLTFDAERYRRNLPDRIVSYEARADQDEHVDELRSVTVQRGGRNQVFRVHELIGVEVTHFRAGSNSQNIAMASPDDISRSSVLDSDVLLNTGLINPGGAKSSLTSDPNENTPGMAVRFRKPVINGVGPDVVFFELQSVLNPPYGDAFHVSPLKFAPGLKSQTISRYDITVLDPEAKSLVGVELRVFKSPPQSLEELLTLPTGHRRPPLRFRAIAVGIDLSDLGFAENAEVDGLFFQDAADDNDHLVDPVFIAGLPAEMTFKVAP